MNYDFIREYTLLKRGTTMKHKVEWGADLYHLEDKMMMMHGTDKIGRPILTLKLYPELGSDLRLEHKDKIIPGYFMNKVHYNSVYLDLDFDEEFIKYLIDESYDTVFKTLTKKKQAELSDD